MQERKDPFQQVELSDNELDNNLYYIKNGTKFIETYKCTILNASNRSNERARTLIVLRNDYKTVPTLYKGEIIAYPSQDGDVPDISLTRYSEIGYSLGFYNLKYDNNNYLSGTLSGNIFQASNLYDVLKKSLPSDNIRLISINNIEAKRLELTDTSVIKGLEKDKSYDIEYYSGTHYDKSSVIADDFMLEEFEYYNLDNKEDTHNGYVSFHMPDDAKSGWYLINNGGLFKYIAGEKNLTEADVDMNEQYYLSEIRKEDIYSQKYSVTLDVKFRDIKFKLNYDEQSILNEDAIKAVIYAPDNSCYDMDIDKDKNEISIGFDEAMPGKWIIYIEPKGLELTDVITESSENQQEISTEVREITIDNDVPNTTFEIEYEGDGDIYALLICPDGTSYNMNKPYEQNHKLSYTMPYVQAGVYKINIYHYMDTNIIYSGTKEYEETQENITVVVE